MARISALSRLVLWLWRRRDKQGLFFVTKQGIPKHCSVRDERKGLKKKIVQRPMQKGAAIAAPQVFGDVALRLVSGEGADESTNVQIVHDAITTEIQY